MTAKIPFRRVLHKSCDFQLLALTEIADKSLVSKGEWKDCTGKEVEPMVHILNTLNLDPRAMYLPLYGHEYKYSVSL